MLNVPTEWGSRDNNLALAIIGDEECGELLYLFFHDGFTHWYHHWEDCADDLFRESHNLQLSQEAQTLLFDWTIAFKKTIREMKEKNLF